MKDFKPRRMRRHETDERSGEVRARYVDKPWHVGGLPLELPAFEHLRCMPEGTLDFSWPLVDFLLATRIGTSFTGR